ncbi:extensin-like [Varroa jacobsoni]|uniref:Uncharacterized protein n=1 Tax=Varroa destructor TaxID=109461 RepID=A0A7M7JJ85_VARDE|nr:extensin-like [Varroa destructor]XP_022653006.1 extensin-like [Varroa destructor]XP_022688631.1 extensin-like [Varroa jacobsoni]XP_022688632.1 extensin-like [Varroa jacobsoni]
MSGHFDPSYFDRRNAELRNQSLNSSTSTYIPPSLPDSYIPPTYNPTYPAPQYQPTPYVPPEVPTAPLMPSFDEHQPPGVNPNYPPAQPGYCLSAPSSYCPPHPPSDTYTPPPAPM